MAQSISAARLDFSEPAELFGGRSWNRRPASLTYRRFDTAAEAIRYAVEVLFSAGQPACVLEVNEKRFNPIEIRKLYNSGDYPLPRKTEKPAAKDADAT